MSKKTTTQQGQPTAPEVPVGAAVRWHGHEHVFSGIRGRASPNNPIALFNLQCVCGHEPVEILMDAETLRKTIAVMSQGLEIMEGKAPETLPAATVPGVFHA